MIEIVGGYGVMSKRIMRSNLLSADAKTIYCYLCAFSAKDCTCYPSAELMRKELDMCESRFNKNMRRLIELGIVERERMRKGNRYGGYLYIINHNADFEGFKFEGIENEGIENEGIENEDIEREDIESQHVVKVGNNNTSNNNTSNNNTSNNNTSNIYYPLIGEVCGLLNKGKAKAGSKGRLKVDSFGASYAMECLQKKDIPHSEILQKAKELSEIEYNGDWDDFVELWERSSKERAEKWKMCKMSKHGY